MSAAGAITHAARFLRPLLTPAKAPVRSPPPSGWQSPEKGAQKASTPRLRPTAYGAHRRAEQTLRVSPDCGTHLNGGWVQRTREVIELPVVPLEVTEHVLVARNCPVCERRRPSKEAFQGVVLGQQRGGQPGEPDSNPAGRGTGCYYEPSNGTWRPSNSCT